NVIGSAVANAKNQGNGVDDSGLYLHSVAVHKGPMRKRMRARAQGRAVRVRKQTAHVDIVVASTSPRVRGEDGTES
ncbi:MAG: uL22 family ribosomal protein, partial [Myxococcota bacterium]